MILLKSMKQIFGYPISLTSLGYVSKIAKLQGDEVNEILNFLKIVCLIFNSNSEFLGIMWGL